MTEINKNIEAIQKGDALLRNNFIKAYQPFILNKIVATTGRYVEKENDDEFTIGLLAFNEAIDSFDTEKGSFLSFASLKIKQRIYDHLRKELKRKDDISIDTEEAKKLKSNDQLDLKLEMTMFKKKLSYFGITMDQLVDKSPKHKSTKSEVTQLAYKVSKHHHLRSKLYKNKRLPLSEVSLAFSASLKSVKSFKGFIVAVVVICHEQLETIKSYLQLEGEENE